MALWQNSGDSLASLTTNLVLSVFPFNQLYKLYHLAPRKHDRNHSTQPLYESPSLPDSQTTTVLPSIPATVGPKSIMNRLLPSELVQNLALQSRTANLRSRTTKLPHVTRSDLLDINHIHAASLSGLANQFAIQNSLAPVLIPSQDSQAPPSPQTNSRKPSSTNSVSQFVALPPSSTLPPPAQPQAVPASTINEQAVSQLINELSNSQQVPPRPSRPSSSSGVQYTSFTNLPPSSSPAREQRPASPANKFASFGSSLGPVTQVGYDSNSLATTNSISIHPQAGQTVQPVVPSSVSPSLPPVSLPPVTTTTTTMSSVMSTASQTPAHQGAHPQHPNVLASYNQPARAHNNLANAKYSLDGIIAVAIFGGFIFLGAIITIIVIIIRR